MDLPVPERVLSALQEGRQAHLAVSTKGGPHVTPELYAYSGGALWLAVASSTLKAKVLRDRQMAGAVVSVGGRSVVMAGTAAVLDPRRPTQWASIVSALPDTGKALARYTVRNAPDLVAFVADAAVGRLGWRVPPLRLVLRFDPSRIALIEDDAIVEGWGGWSGWHAGREVQVPAGGQRAVVALPGPLAVPGRWFEDDGLVHVVPGLLDNLHLPEDAFPLSLVTDEYSAPGPAAKHGTLLRGTGRLDRRNGLIAVDTQRTVEWDGVETTTMRT
jgi:Pyridoxamine 5'-phosphate oxidase